MGHVLAGSGWRCPPAGAWPWPPQVLVGPRAKKSDNAFVGGENRWKYSSFVNWCVLRDVGAGRVLWLRRQRGRCWVCSKQRRGVHVCCCSLCGSSLLRWSSRLSGPAFPLEHWRSPRTPARSLQG